MRLPDPADDPGYYRYLIAKRALAWVVDFAIVLVAVLLLGLLTLFTVFAIFPLLWAALSVLYRFWMLTRYDATLGMRLASIRLRSLEGARPEPGVVLGHAVIHAACAFTVIGQIASIAMMITSPYRQGLNDRLLGTTMIHYDPEFDAA